jgi:radical SAM/Cys-rich protein
VESTLQSLEEDAEFQITAQNLKKLGQKRLTLDERKKRRRALDNLNIPDFGTFLDNQGLEISRLQSTILQLNIGLYCNQACNHCHVESSPKRVEHMTQEIIDKCFDIVDKSPSIKTIDITGGAPEMNPGFREIVVRARERNLEVIDRCNLTVLMEPGQEDLPQFLAQHKVRVCASLPCYSERNVNLQRGANVFQRSIKGLQLLNDQGYGQEGSDLFLDLVYNPGGAFLPPDQGALQDEYKQQLKDDFHISFNNLFTITNMPIKRFADMLSKSGKLEEYMTLLVQSFNPTAISGLMCRDTLSVSWDGKLYDCDFNQQLQLGLGETLESVAPEADSGSVSAAPPLSVFDVESVAELLRHRVTVDHHCFGCTAGAGSSCQGATI